MKDYFEILGTQIRYEKLRSYRLVQREYIYRPCYITVTSQGLFRSKKLYQFHKMIPYAAIISESEYRAGSDGPDLLSAVGNAAKDLLDGAFRAVGGAFSSKGFTDRKYCCMNSAGRKFQTYLNEIPALVVSEDRRAADVYHNDELYPMLGEPIAPAINMVYCLMIQEEQTYYFFGNGIQLRDIGAVYQALRDSYEQYRAEKKAQPAGLFGSLFGAPRSEAENALAALRGRYENGELTEAEYRTQIDDIMKKL